MSDGSNLLERNVDEIAAAFGIPRHLIEIGVNCPRCGQPCTLAEHWFADLDTLVAYCNPCGLINVMGSPGPWLERPSNTLLLDVYDEGMRTIDCELRARAEALGRGAG